MSQVKGILSREVMQSLMGTKKVCEEERLHVKSTLKKSTKRQEIEYDGCTCFLSFRGFNF